MNFSFARRVAAALATCTLATAATAQGVPFSEIDRNRDGLLSYDELVESFGQAGADRVWSRGDGNAISREDARRIQRGRNDDDNDGDDDRGSGGRNDNDNDGDDDRGGSGRNDNDNDGDDDRGSGGRNDNDNDGDDDRGGGGSRGGRDDNDNDGDD